MSLVRLTAKLGILRLTPRLTLNIKALYLQCMSSNNLKELQLELKKFAEERDWDQFHSVKNLLLALVGEVGELTEIFQWLEPSSIENLDLETNIRAEEEVADVLLYLIRIADKLDIDLNMAARRKLALNAEKYPVIQSKGNAIKYNQREK